MGVSTVSKSARLFVVASLGWLVLWQMATLLGYGRRVAVVLGLYGFVFHTVFGKAYALVPSYFARSLAFSKAPFVHLPLAVGGTGAMAVDAAGSSSVRVAGTIAWGLGTVVFVATIVWSVRDNLTGADTGTGEAKAARRRVDRFANGFIPLALGYLLVGTVLSVITALGYAASVPFAVVGAPLTHLFAVGTAALFVFALGFRLLPRFLVVSPREWLVAVVLPAAAAGPLFLVVGFGGGILFRLGAVLQTVALGGFALAYIDMFHRSQRRRVGLYTFLIAAISGAAVGLLGLHMAIAGITVEAAEVHVRLALLGFLGLAIVGVSYQFYPPGVASLPGIDDRTAAAAVVFLTVGLAVECGGLLADYTTAVTGGRGATLVGAGLHALVLGVVFVERWQ